MTPTVRLADYTDAKDAETLVDLLDQYAKDPFGGSQGLSNHTKSRLAVQLSQLPNANTLLAFNGDIPVGVANCFTVFSTFKCKPVLNIHDFAVSANARKMGVGLALMEAINDLAVELQCCKITLEVLTGNTPAKALYRKFGFTGYELDPDHGAAEFWEKPL